MATTTTTITSTHIPTLPEEQPLVYGCVHVESILRKHGERIRQEYDSAMSVVIQSSRAKAGKVKMCQDCMDPTRKSLMCFTCPYVGCTRKGHIRRHYRDNLTHRLSIDCDNGNIYCHVCDDFIYDPTLQAIQRAKRVILGKRKRDAEEVPVLNGKDSSSSSSDSSISAMQIVPPQTCKIAGLRGIQNLGNTCYMSSILQSFIHNPIVRNHYLSDAHHSNLCTRQNCIHCTINTVFSRMYTPVRPDPAQAFGPTDFISTIWKIDNTFAGTDQQDSHEFLMFLLNAMHAHHTHPDSEATNGDEERGCKCLAHQVFGGESQSQVTCRGCGKTNRKVEMMFDIGLQIRGKAKVVITLNGKNNGGSVKGSPTSPSSSAGSSDTGDGMTGSQCLQDCLDKYTTAEHLDQSQYTCSNCSTSTATKQMSIKVLPNVLCLQLKRFDGRQAKVDEHVRFPITLDMTPYTSHTISNQPDNRDCTYDLFAIVSHIGANIHKGHYINYAKFSGEWFAFNDHIVEWVTEETVLRSKAYLCFYIKHCLEYEYDETLKSEKGQTA